MGGLYTAGLGLGRVSCPLLQHKDREVRGDSALSRIDPEYILSLR